jgi:arabinofuranosyltransferase
MLLVAGAYALTREAYFTVIGVSVAVSAAAIATLTRWLTSSPATALITLAALASSRAFVEYSTSGLENPLTHLLLAAFFVCLTRLAAGARRTLALSTCTGLLLLTRQDAVLLVLPSLLWVAASERRLASLGWMALGFVPVVAWELFSLVYYGFLVPNTAYAKLNTGIPWDESVEQGLLYLLDAAEWDPGTVLLIGLGLATAIGSRRAWARTMGAGIALSVAYVVWVGGDFMSGRFLTPACFASVALLSLQRWPRLHRWWPSVAVALVLITVASPRSAFGDTTLTQRFAAVMPNGIADERRFYAGDTGLLTPQRPSLNDYPWVREARALPTFATGTIVFSALGFVGFQLGPKVHVIDTFALAEPLLARLPALARWRVGHFTRAVPDGYEETVRTGSNVIVDQKLARYYDELSLITRGPVWSWARWRAIVRFNTGAMDHLIADIGLARVPAQAIAQPRVRGTLWDDPGNTRIPDGGVAVELGATTAGRWLELGLSANDTYHVELRHAGVPQRRFRLDPLPGAPRDIETRHLAIPPETPFDEVRIMGRRGDYRYSLGHVRVLG